MPTLFHHTCAYIFCPQICRSTCPHTFSCILYNYGLYSYGLYTYVLYGYGCTPFASIHGTPSGHCKAVSCMRVHAYTRACVCACVCVRARVCAWVDVSVVVCIHAFNQAVCMGMSLKVIATQSVGVQPRQRRVCMPLHTPSSCCHARTNVRV